MWNLFSRLHKVSGPTCGELVEAYLRSTAFLALSDTSKAPYRRVIERWLREDQLAGRKVRSIDRGEIEAMLARRSPGAANDLLKKIRILMRFGIERGWRRDDPAAGIRRYPAGLGHHTWTEDEIRRFEQRWPFATRERLAFALMLYTGQRRSDVVRMRWADIEESTLAVTQGKTGVRLAIPLHPQLQLALTASIPSRGAETILVTSFGKAFSSNGFGGWMAERIDHADLPQRCVTHGLRKAAARRLAEAGCSAHEIAAITGHRTLKEVERYTRGAEQARLAAAAIKRM